LVSQPFNNAWGSSIYAYVNAQNNYGVSDNSAVGNGAVITNAPDAPLSLAENLLGKSSTSIALTWADGAANGGAAVLDYTITYDQGTATWVVLASNLMTRSYVASDLTSGTTYSFKVQSRNSYGLSSYSNAASILCAFVPDTPVAPSSTVLGSNAIISWTVPANNGSPITTYTVTIRNSANSYITDLNNCNGGQAEIVAAASCTIPLATLITAPFSLSLGSSIDVRV
jgi:hypothetical protein